MQPAKAGQSQDTAILFMQYYKKYAIKRWQTCNQDLAIIRRDIGVSEWSGGAKRHGPDGFIRQGRLLGGESKTIPDGGYAKLTR